MIHFKIRSSSYGFDVLLKYTLVKDNYRYNRTCVRKLIKSCKTEIPSPLKKKMRFVCRKRWFGSFRCTCGRSWSSGYTWTLDDKAQPMECQNCMSSVLPYQLVSSTFIYLMFFLIKTQFSTHSLKILLASLSILG